MRNSRRPRGFGVTELMVSLAVFSGLLILLALVLSGNQDVWRKVTGTSDVSLQIRRGASRLKRDLSQASLARLSLGNSPGSLGTTADGHAVWFLSCRDDNENPTMKLDGSPFWRSTILYYVTVAKNHDQVYGQSCSNGAGPAGVDDRCPHKLLIRKELDIPPSTTPPANEEILPGPTQVSPFMTRPDSQQVGTALPPGVRKATVECYPCLGMTLLQQGRNLRIDLRAVNLELARKKLHVGTDSLWDSPHTFVQSLTVPIQMN